MSIASLAGTIIQVLALVAVGVVLRATGIMKREHSSVLNKVIVYVALPAMIFKSMYSAPLSWEVVRIAGVAWVAALAGIGGAWLLARAMKLPRRTAGAFILVAGIGNTGYLGYPIAKLLLGDLALSRAIFYDVFGTVGVLFTLGVVVASEMGEHDEGDLSAVALARELFTFPAMVALLAALAVRFVPVSEAVRVPVGEWLGIVGSMTVPLIMVSLGLSLTAQGFRSRPAALGAATAVKLLVVPAVALLAALALGLGDATRLVVLQASMPTVMLSLVIGQRFGLDTDFIASAILTTTVACVLTIPVVQLLVR